MSPKRPESLTAGAERSAVTDDLVLDVRDLAVHFQLHGGALSRLLGLNTSVVRAVDGVSVGIRRGEVLGLVGESGSGKTTLGRALLGLVNASGGSITYHGRSGDQDVAKLKGKGLRQLRTDLQMAFQDPHAALNPSMTIEESVGDPLAIHRIGDKTTRRQRVVDALARVGLAPAEAFLDKLPRDLSGGQKQRAVIARAIILDPEVLVADEPISMLDMSVRAKILQLMLDLKRDLGLTYVYITHDLASAKYFCDRIAIMYLGRVVEIGSTEEIFANPRHPYTQALLKAIPDPDPDRQVARDVPPGEIPDAAEPPLGCSFHPRCPQATPECGWEARDLRALLEAHWTRGSPEVFEAERQVIGSLEQLEQSAKSVTFGRGGGEDVRAILDRARAKNPDAPLWSGIEQITPAGSGVTVEFQPGVDPPLRRAGGVDVACVLYPEEAPGSAAGGDVARPQP